MENIITFGSCLSRHIARSYKRLFSAEIISSVYHNRSDYFVNNFVNNVKKNQLSDYTFTSKEAEEIFLNQTFDGLGKHKLDIDMNLIEVLSSIKIDYILIDNFMDVSSKLAVSSGKDVAFIRSKDVDNFYDIFTIGNYIDTLESISNFNIIIDFFKKSQPNAKVFFFNFPYNVYEDDFRKKRTLDFYNKFKRNDIFVIPPMNIPKIYRTEVNSHFEEPQYACYAGIIRALAKGNNIL